jgi:hypothetical protein
MAFLSDNRDTKERAHPAAQYHHILAKDSTQFYKGQLVGVDLDDGKLMGATAGDLTIQVVGRCEENVLTGTSNTRRVKVKSGAFIWVSGGTYEAITVAHRGQNAYVVDDQTVGISGATGANTVAGRIEDVDSYGVHVFTMWPLPSGALGPTGATGPTGPTGPTGA